MPTVGWIREGDLDAFYERTERTPDPSPPKEPSFVCPFCASAHSCQSDFLNHVYERHRVERPLIMLRGKEPSRQNVVRTLLHQSEIAVTNTSFAKVCIDGASAQRVSPEHVKEIMTKTPLVEIKLELVNAVERNATPVVTHYDFSFRVADQEALRKVESAFTNFLVSGAIVREAIENFLADSGTQDTGREYASGLAAYCLGILLKERPEDEKLTTPLSRYRELYGDAFEILEDFQRPLAHLITSVIRFSMNNFGNGGPRTGLWKLDMATELLLDPNSETMPLEFKKPGQRLVCPIDQGTDRILQLASHLIGQPQWSPVLADECRKLAHSDFLDVNDRQKAFAIWAAMAWRLGSKRSALEPLTQIAGVFPFSRWAGQCLEQVST